TNATNVPAGWTNGWFEAMPPLPPAPLERAACLTLLAFAATVQVSIAAAEILLLITAVLWVAVVVQNRERIEVPAMFWPLAALGLVTLVSAVFSIDPEV